MIAMVKAVKVKALDARRLWLRFPDSSAGVRDLSDVLGESGPMIQPLRNPAFFDRVFLESGVPI